MTKQQLKEECEMLQKYAEGVFDEAGFFDMMIFIFVTNKKSERGQVVMPIPKYAMAKRFELLNQVGKNLSNYVDVKSVDGIALISEAWISEYTKEEDDKMKAEGKEPPMPRDDPRRMEVLQVVGMSDVHDVYQIQFEIVTENEKRKLINMKGEEMVGSEQRLFNNFWRGVLNI